MFLLQMWCTWDIVVLDYTFTNCLSVSKFSEWFSRAGVENEEEWSPHTHLKRLFPVHVVFLNPLFNKHVEFFPVKCFWKKCLWTLSELFVLKCAVIHWNFIVFNYNFFLSSLVWLIFFGTFLNWILLITAQFDLRFGKYFLQTWSPKQYSIFKIMKNCLCASHFCQSMAITGICSMKVCGVLVVRVNPVLVLDEIFLKDI